MLKKVVVNVLNSAIELMAISGVYEISKYLCIVAFAESIDCNTLALLLPFFFILGSATMNY